MTDIRMENHGSIWLFRPVSEAAREHLDGVIDEMAQWFGNALVVEPRYVSDLATSLEDDGLDVKLGSIEQ